MIVFISRAMFTKIKWLKKKSASPLKDAEGPDESDHINETRPLQQSTGSGSSPGYGSLLRHDTIQIQYKKGKASVWGKKIALGEMLAPGETVQAQVLKPGDLSSVLPSKHQAST